MITTIKRPRTEPTSSSNQLPSQKKEAHSVWNYVRIQSDDDEINQYWFESTPENDAILLRFQDIQNELVRLNPASQGSYFAEFSRRTKKEVKIISAFSSFKEEQMRFSHYFVLKVPEKMKTGLQELLAMLSTQASYSKNDDGEEDEEEEEQENTNKLEESDRIQEKELEVTSFGETDVKLIKTTPKRLRLEFVPNEPSYDVLRFYSRNEDDEEDDNDSPMVTVSQMFIEKTIYNSGLMDKYRILESDIFERDFAETGESSFLTTIVGKPVEQGKFGDGAIPLRYIKMIESDTAAVTDTCVIEFKTVNALPNHGDALDANLKHRDKVKQWVEENGMEMEREKLFKKVDWRIFDI